MPLRGHPKLVRDIDNMANVQTSEVRATAATLIIAPKIVHDNRSLKIMSLLLGHC